MVESGETTIRPAQSGAGPTENPTWFERLRKPLLNNPVWLVVIIIITLISLPVALWFDLRDLSARDLSRQAETLNRIVTEIRTYYSRNVVDRVVANRGRATPAHNYADIAGGIPIPATLSIELAEVIGRSGGHVDYRFVSDQVFENREPHAMDSFESEALAWLRGSGGQTDAVTQMTGTLLDRTIRMAVPVIMGPECVACHNAHEESPRRDWKVGDVRGIQSLTIAQPLAEDLFAFRYLLIYLLFAGALGAAFILLQWRQAKRFAAMNMDLEEANSFLAAISLKISKYLSPQVYRSIFSGARDAVIATERKKLTIFFSDIKDFTVVTERLQPEELTSLLNEYFSEMSRIANAHGATVDKFIGDAILAFVGDPDSMGTREDALACVKMAVAMQRRLRELSAEWHRRGIENPFQARMGINTGYCNVGNFGSAERMDYTIIGAEANLAARLESIAEPGGIVLSYETYALVADHVDAQPLEPITLKGISRQIIPYALRSVDGQQADMPEKILVRTSERLRLKIDLKDLGSEEAVALETELSEALDRVRKAVMPMADAG
jgi:adenylate cyclase